MSSDKQSQISIHLMNLLFQVGIFPDAYDCRKFHLCSPPEGLPDGRTADHRPALCPRHYGYNPATAQCSVSFNIKVILAAARGSFRFYVENYPTETYSWDKKWQFQTIIYQQIQTFVFIILVKCESIYNISRYSILIHQRSQTKHRLFPPLHQTFLLFL